MIIKSIYEDKRLRLRDVALYIYLVRQPSLAGMSIRKLASDLTDGFSSIRAGVHTLVRCGYLSCKRQRSGHMIWRLRGKGSSYILLSDKQNRVVDAVCYLLRTNNLVTYVSGKLKAKIVAMIDKGHYFNEFVKGIEIVISMRNIYLYESQPGRRPSTLTYSQRHIKNEANYMLSIVAHGNVVRDKIEWSRKAKKPTFKLTSPELMKGVGHAREMIYGPNYWNKMINWR